MDSAAGKPTALDSDAVAATEDGADNDSDVEIEGMDLEGDDGDDNDDGDVDMEPSADALGTDAHATTTDEGVSDQLAHDDRDELDAARKERTELMAAERKKVAAPSDGDKATMGDKLQYLLSQSDVFAHFLAGSVAATDKKRGGGKKKGSRGKKNRMTEAEEDAQLLKTAESKRSVIRLDKQPACLADHCKMHGYQLEGLNWLIKLHCNGLNGILADEVSKVSPGVQ